MKRSILLGDDEERPLLELKLLLKLLPKLLLKLPRLLLLLLLWGPKSKSLGYTMDGRCIEARRGTSSCGAGASEERVNATENREGCGG